MDHLRENWAKQDIRDWLNLTEAQLRLALEYIAAHRKAVEAEYAEVVQASSSTRSR